MPAVGDELVRRTAPVGIQVLDEAVHADPQVSGPEHGGELGELLFAALHLDRVVADAIDCGEPSQDDVDLFRRHLAPPLSGSERRAPGR